MSKSLIGLILTIIGFVIVFATIYGLITDLLVSIFRVKSQSGTLSANRLIGAITISTGITGILSYYNPEELVDKKFAFLMNLQRRKLMGVESQCMILAAEDNSGNVKLVTTERDIASGSRIL